MPLLRKNNIQRLFNVFSVIVIAVVFYNLISIYQVYLKLDNPFIPGYLFHYRVKPHYILIVSDILLWIISFTLLRLNKLSHKLLICIIVILFLSIIFNSEIVYFYFKYISQLPD